MLLTHGRVAESQALLASRQISVPELLEQHLDRVERLDGGVRAWVEVDADGARHAAASLQAELDRGAPQRPLHGVPVGVKDIFDVVGLPTLAGSRVRSRAPARSDATAVSRLREAGALILGKTHTAEFAGPDPAPTVNPIRPEHTPGGSSSGSAAAVAAGMCLLALGSQSAGSTLRPAAYCGIVGFKPARGRIPTTGMLPNSPHLDHVGLLAMSVGDASRAYGAIRDRATVPAPGGGPWRLGVLWAGGHGPVSPETEQHLARVVEELAARGVVVQDVEAPAGFEAGGEALWTILRADLARVHVASFKRAADRYGPGLRALLEDGSATPPAAYAQARRVQAWLTATMAPVVARFDAVLTPAVPEPAPRGLASTGDPELLLPWTLLGYPALALPSGWSESGLPLAIQLVATPAGESRLLELATWCEEVLMFEPFEPR